MKHPGVLITALVILGNCGTVFLTGCGGGASLKPTPSPNPTPTITTITPGSSTAGGAPFTLTINGTSFIASSTVNFGGTTPVTTFVSATQLTAAIPASAVASVGTAAVTVANPAPGGGTSNAVSFTISSGTNPVPTINALDPGCSPKGEQSLSPFANGQLLVLGQNFAAGSVVRWNGNDRTTTFVSSSRLTAQISASDIAAVGTASVTVFNPPPGGGSSNTSTFTITAGGVSPQSIVVDPNGKFAYVADAGCGGSLLGYVSAYTIDAATGVLASTGPPVPSNDVEARSVTVDPFGKFAYVGNDGGDLTGSLAMYTIDATTGALTSTGTIPPPCTPPPSAGSCSPDSLAVDPSGKFVYAANEGGFAPTSVSMYSINGTTGALTLIGVAGAGGRADSVAVDPTGKFAYATNDSNSSPGVGNSVSMYAVDTTTGALTFIGTITAGTNPVSIAVDPKGKFAYVANADSNNLSTYTINTTTGLLTSTGMIAAGAQPVSVAVDPTGKFAYAVNFASNDVSMYAIDTTTGVLTSLGTIGAELSPTSITIHPSGKFAYVTNSDSNSVSMYSIDTSTGALTLIGTVGT